MKYLIKLYRKLFPRKFNHNPEDFMIKPVKSWFSPLWYHIMYSANKGESWEFLYEAQRPLFSYDYKTLSEYDWGWSKISFKPEKTSFKEYSDNFKCYQDILDFNSKEEERIRIGKIERQDKLKEYRKKFDENLS
jgi:hypothetical protein